MKSWLIILLFIAFSLQAQTPLPDIRPITEVAIATVHIKGFPDFLTEDEDGMWVTNEERVEKLQFGKPGIVQKVNVSQPCGVMAVGFGSLWVASCERKGIYRIDLISGLIQAIIVTGLADEEGELSVAVGAGSIWILSNSLGELSRVNPENNKVVSRIKVAPDSFAAAFGFGVVWITNTKNSSVQRIDPISEKIEVTIPVGKGPRFLTAGAGAVWTLNQEDGTVSKIDPLTNQALTIEAEANGTGGDICAGNKYVYVRAKNTLLSVIDSETNRVISRLGPPAGSGAVRIEHGRVWVTAHDVNTIWILKE